MKSTTLNMYRVVDFACVDMYISTLKESFNQVEY